MNVSAFPTRRAALGLHGTFPDRAVTKSLWVITTARELHFGLIALTITSSKVV